MSQALYYLGRFGQLLGMWLLLVDVVTASSAGPNPRLFAVGVAVFFGIKAGSSWQGDSVSVKTLEFEGGVPVPRQAKFRSYDSAADSFREYVDVLRNNPRYAGALNTGSDAKAFAGALQRGGYATDPRYAMKIESIAQNLPISETALKSSTDAPMTSTIDLF